ncbi:MAG: hypothetical protein PF488_00555 [Patescibacteria group bacterium]|jgi:hypothetical protein|nr:hypothetical protein [Patescibacteria group bacterium]
MLTQNARKNIGVGIIVLGLLIIALIVYFIIIKPQEEPGFEIDENNQLVQENETVNQEGTTTPNNIPRNYQEYDVSREEEHAFNSLDLGKLANSFAERFGSYTNQSQYENFTDLKMFMTSSFSSWVDDYVEELKDESPDNKYFYGITTTAITHEIVEFDEQKGEGIIVINTERKETTINGDNEAFRQELELHFEKVNNEWLVDAAYWD